MQSGHSNYLRSYRDQTQVLLKPDPDEDGIFYDANSGMKWFGSDREDNEYLYKWIVGNNTKQKVQCEIAVLGGNFYKLIFKDPHYPNYYVFVDPDERYFRCSAEIPNFERWCDVVKYDENTQTLTIMGYPLISGTNYIDVDGDKWTLVNFAKMIYGSAFLGDADLAGENIGIIKLEAEKKFVCVKIDPGCCLLLAFFLKNDNNDVAKLFKNILTNHPDVVLNEFTIIRLFQDGDTVLPMPLIRGLLSSEAAKQEIRELFHTINSLSPVEIMSTINLSLSDPAMKQVFFDAFQKNATLYQPFVERYFPEAGEKEIDAPPSNRSVSTVSFFSGHKEEDTISDILNIKKTKQP